MVDDVLDTVGDILSGGGDAGGGVGSPVDTHHKPRSEGSWIDDFFETWAHKSAEKNTSQNNAKDTKTFVERVSKWPIRPRMYFARGLGEIASVAAAPVAMVVVDKGLHEPYEDLKWRIAQKWILPNLQGWDDTLAELKSFDPPHEREERHALPPEQQAKKIADLWIDQFGVKFGASLAGQWATQDYFIQKFNAGVPKKYNAMSVFVDRGVQLGSAVLLNTALSEQAVHIQEGLINVFKKAGMDEEKAEDWANFAVNFQLPNAIAYLVSAEMLTHVAKRA